MGVRLQRLLPALVLVSAAWRAEAQGGGTRLGSVAFGDCELQSDPAPAAVRSTLGFSACLRGRAGAEATFVAGTPAENSWIRYAHGDAGVFYGEWLSLHARGDLRDKIPLGEGVTGYQYRDTDSLVMQIGNPALHRYRLVGGRARLPFGIDESQATEHYRSFEDRSFWSSPRHGAWVTLDDREALQLDFGAATDEWRHDANDERSGTPPADGPVASDGDGSASDVSYSGDDSENSGLVARAVSARLSMDFSALDGSRLLFSGYGENTGVRRMGLGFVTVSRKEDMTEFEFVRRLSAPGSEAAHFRQLLRLGYVGAFRGATRWVVQFDDERFHHRMGMIGQDAIAAGHLLFRFGLTYYKSETGDGLRRWYLTSGLEARL